MPTTCSLAQNNVKFGKRYEVERKLHVFFYWITRKIETDNLGIAESFFIISENYDIKLFPSYNKISNLGKIK
jgi:hypothetical protein